MVKRTVAVQVERFPTAGAFVISRGSKSFVDVVTATVAEGGAAGRGEATPIYYHGETADGLAAQIRAAAAEVEGGASRDDLLRLLPAGGARKALDCALWDLEARLTGRRVWELAGVGTPRPIETAFTISLGAPAVMEAAARAARRYTLLKLKLAGEGDRDRLAAVRRGHPTARLIVDANEAWGGRDIAAAAAELSAFGVEMIEQPVPAGQDALLDGVRSSVALCADETVHDRATLAAVEGRYALVNIKLDKAGGLTEALALGREAHRMGLEIMTGCMLSTSLGVAPAYVVGLTSRYADLDGPLLLAADRANPIRFDGSMMHPPEPELWG